MKIKNEIQNKLICGDNLEELRKLKKESVDLIYIDPPFFTNRQYEVVWGDEAEVRSYKDRWEGGIEHYIGWLKPRIQLMYDLLKPTGSFYIHCDWHANAYIRIMLDDIFGLKNFRNEIIWHYQPGSAGKKDFGKKHDTIFRYSKSNMYNFYPESIREPYSEKTLERLKHKGAREKNTKKVLERGGRVPTDVWYYSSLQGNAKEFTGYPTQKPEALLERIIKASSNEGDVVADFFCGCGTTIAVAQKLKRKWIGIDISPTAIKVIERRLTATKGTVGFTEYKVLGTPNSLEEAKKLEPFEFQNWVVIDKMGAHSSKKKTGDMGLDGHYIKGSLFIPDGAGIQVKQSEKVGRNVVDNFETALRRADYKKGYIVAFSFTKGSYEEVARINNKKNLEIKLITIKELLEKKKPII